MLLMMIEFVAVAMMMFVFIAMMLMVFQSHDDSVLALAHADCGCSSCLCL